ncbi:hypothetical protein BKA70DRAFT_742398 [Coprinopsis sp. MPI-PUGE-AT-0042]|nr:hypothetical protein BKA70DRAFT_742398 [Coprinopsis sp. MPI-PUGE-AT-0042]
MAETRQPLYTSTSFGPMLSVVLSICCRVLAVLVIAAYTVPNALCKGDLGSVGQALQTESLKPASTLSFRFDRRQTCFEDGAISPTFCLGYCCRQELDGRILCCSGAEFGSGMEGICCGSRQGCVVGCRAPSCPSN